MSSAVAFRPVARRVAHSDLFSGAAPLSDRRLPAVVKELARLRRAGRLSVRIVDADCGAGTALSAIARVARALGFTAIEGRGIDGSPTLIARARTAAAGAPDPAIGLRYEVADVAAALAGEADFPADILLWRSSGNAATDSALAPALAAAANLVVTDPTR